MKIDLAIGMSGLASSIFSSFRKPIQNILADVDDEYTTMFSIWNKWPDLVRYIVNNRHSIRTLTVGGHSYGFSAATRVGAALEPYNINVDLMWGIDIGIDSGFIKAEPVTANVSRLVEYDAQLRGRAKVSAAFTAARRPHYYYDTKAGHVAAASTKIVREGVTRAILDAKRSD